MQDGIKGLHMIMHDISCIIYNGQGHSLGIVTKIHISELSSITADFFSSFYSN